jgi:hypothetical protein
VREDDPVIARVRSALVGIPSIRSIDHKPFTGSLLIEYEPGMVEPDQILSRIVTAGGLAGVVDEATLRREAPSTAETLVTGAHRLNDIVRQVTGGRSDLRMMIPATFATAGVFSLLTRPVSPSWDSFLYWSYVFFVDLNRHAVEKVEGPGHGSAASGGGPP